MSQKWYVVVIVLVTIVLLTGCSSTANFVEQVRDPKASKSCGVIKGVVRGQWSDLDADYFKFYCSDELPDCMEYEFKKDGAVIKMKTPCKGE